MKITIFKYILLLSVGICYGVDALQPEVVFQEAQAAYRKKEYNTALEKIIWYWDNAAKIDPALFGVRGSAGRDLFYKISKETEDGRAKYTERMENSLNGALQDLSDPAKSEGGKMPQNHLLFLDYVSLSEKIQSNKEINDTFKKLESVNPSLAKWEFWAVVDHLMAEKEYIFMNKYISSWDIEQKSIVSGMMFDYKMMRDGKMAASDLMGSVMRKIKTIKLVYLKNKRDFDLMQLNFFCQMSLTDDENKELENSKDEF